MGEARQFKFGVPVDTDERFGPRHDADCANLTMKNGEAIVWVSTCRYIGVYFVSGRELKCCFDQDKQKFFRSFNAILVK